MTPENVRRYLNRIRAEDQCPPTLETLRRLHRAHMFAVPFENLDIHLGVPLLLSIPALFDKIVERRRGGFCYELNGLFAWLLETLGFNVKRLSGRVFENGHPGPEYDHMLLLVELKSRWIADVGFGDSFLEPLLLTHQAGQEQGSRTYTLLSEGTQWTLHRSGTSFPAAPQYIFTLLPRTLEDFVPMCIHHQTSPDSHFTQKRVCSVATEEGRITLSENRLITTVGEKREERDISDRDEYLRILTEEFGIDLDGTAELFPGAPSPARSYHQTHGPPRIIRPD